MASAHLDNLINANYGSANLQVVFTDIVKYSLRKSTIQRAIIEAFTGLVKNALHRVGQKHLAYAQAHNANFATDVIKLPTGDGIAVVFPFEGLQTIALDFSELLLECIYSHSEQTPCEKFTRDGWCNCHSSFSVRVGVHEGKGIVYTDLNGGYNVAGNVINIAARLMGMADGMQALFSRDAYTNLVDMTTDTKTESQFKAYSNVKVKHGIRLDIYQYCPSDKPFINGGPPQGLMLQQRMENATRSLSPGLAKLDSLPESEMLGLQQTYVQMVEGLCALLQGDPVLAGSVLKAATGASGKQNQEG